MNSHDKVIDILKTIPHDEQIDLYKSIPTVATTFNRMAQEYKVLFRLIYCCGLRNNEACSLKIQNVDLINGCITLHNTKGNKERIVYLSTDLQKLCSDYLKWLLDDLGSNKTEWFFPGRKPDNHIHLHFQVSAVILNLLQNLFLYIQH